MKKKFDILQFGPCIDAIRYYENYDSFEQAWQDCQRGDWMIWIAFKLKVDKKLLFKAKALCAKTVEHLMKDQRSKDAVQAALDYADGKITEKQLKVFACAAADAYGAYADNYAAVAANAAYAGDYAAVAASAAYGAAAKIKNQLQTSDICRDILTDEILKITAPGGTGGY